MAGIYFHIPFCRSRCIYCDFFSSTSLNEKELYIDSICNELQDRKAYLQDQPVQTIYFGGGTPSQLSARDFEKVFQMINLCYPEVYNQLGNIEITLEANPDDINPEYVNVLRQFPFNRISLGVQSFDNKELRFLHRRHSALSAINAVKSLQKAGFDNINIDLIYGLPGQTPVVWEKNLHQAIALDIQHISAYHLTYEEETPLFKLWKQGLIRPVEEEVSILFFDLLVRLLANSGFEHYEISNFAKPGYRSRHNSAYWNGSHYLGIGASAHSYNGFSRQWNKKEAGAGYRFYRSEREIIDAKTAYNDFIITRLRTMEGIDFQELVALFGKERKTYCLKQAQSYIETQHLAIDSGHLRLTRKGIEVSDRIMSDLLAED
ncbi:MAG: radical SAM family heme chaperone HemW [Tannerella sp.]|jgi:oxygen-independent coproporphyrinogen-3 oxidase|nr:radical SAM family heme chaperone HemW [Tannerella sp.]